MLLSTALFWQRQRANSHLQVVISPATVVDIAVHCWGTPQLCTFLDSPLFALFFHYCILFRHEGFVGAAITQPATCKTILTT